MENQSFETAKKSWSFQNMTNQNKKKIAPYEQKIKAIQSEKNISMKSKEEEYKKATLGLKRMMTQFSLADMYTSSNRISMETTPTILNTFNKNKLSSSPSSSLVTLSTATTTTSVYQDINNSSTVVDLKSWFLSSSSTIFGSSHLDEKPLPVLPMNGDQQLNDSSLSIQKSNMNHRLSQEKILHCRVIQIINRSSSKEYEYELYVKVNDVTQSIQSGVLKKIENGISGDYLNEQLSFKVNNPFSLTFAIFAKPICSTKLKKMKKIISSLSIYQDKKNQDSPVDITTVHSYLPMVGFTHLLSGNQYELFKGKEFHRYTLTKPVLSNNEDNDFVTMDLELMIAFHLEEKNENIIPNPFSSPSLKTLFNSCQHGDFLSFYTKNTSSSFSWVRYWATLDKGLCLPLEEKDKKSYNQPDHIIVLLFRITINQPSLSLSNKKEVKEEERISSVYICAESSKKAALWQKILSVFATIDTLSSNTTTTSTSTFIPSYYLW
ncbi:unnamed protein product [Cunninghamella echinulata]